MGQTISRSVESRESIIAYRNFLKLYRNQHRQMRTNDAFSNAARVWGTFSPAQRNRYAHMRVAPKRANKMAGKVAARKKVVKKNLKAKRVPQRRARDVVTSYRPLIGSRAPVAGVKKISNKEAIRESLLPSNGFLNFMEFYHEIHREMPKSLAVKEAVSVWSDMNVEQRGIFSMDL
uniref:GG11172 n=1 Tax=Drosophila erecta TaxID=7220 RepID=B3P8I1_DROER